MTTEQATEARGQVAHESTERRVPVGEGGPSERGLVVGRVVREPHERGTRVLGRVILDTPGAEPPDVEG